MVIGDYVLTAMSKRSAVKQSPSTCANERDVLAQGLQDDGMFPNSRLPLLLYRMAVRFPGLWRSAVFRGTGDLTLVACNGGERSGSRK
jgi:hypothetical protein